LLQLLWPANRAVLEEVDESFPKWPVLLVGHVLVLKKPGFRQLFSNFRVAHPHTTIPQDPLYRLDLLRHTVAAASPNAALQALFTENGKRALLLNSTLAVAALQERNPGYQG
jgi:broad specificity phosphatase PhoE